MYTREWPLTIAFCCGADPGSDSENINVYIYILIRPRSISIYTIYYILYI